MKLFLLICSYFLFSLLFCCTAQSQDIKLVDLIKNECKDSACFNSFITEKGFKYVQSSGGEKINFISYISPSFYVCTSDPTIKLPEAAVFGIRNRNIVDIVFATPKRENYLALTNEIKDMGFKFKKFENMEEGKEWLTFYSSNYPNITLFTNYPETKEDQPCIFYKVRFMKPF